MTKFYTYMWLRNDGTPYYIGKGKLRRAMRSEDHNVHRPKSNDRIILQEWPCENDAFEAEKFLIACYGRLDLGAGCLRNKTDGGDGPSGVIWNDDMRRKMSERMSSPDANKEGLKVGWYLPKSWTHCKRGHSLEGSRPGKNGKGYTIQCCRICARDRMREYRERLKAMA
jgi:hypothetical protein